MIARMREGIIWDVNTLLAYEQPIWRCLRIYFEKKVDNNVSFKIKELEFLLAEWSVTCQTIYWVEDVLLKRALSGETLCRVTCVRTSGLSLSPYSDLIVLY